MFQKLTFYTVLMLFVPIIAWLIGWQWTGDENIITTLDYPLYWLTESGSVPYAILTCVLLMLWLMYLTRHRYSWLLVGAICAGSVIGTQAIKTVAKQSFAEPRPYVVAMTGEKTDHFYALSRDERSEWVAQHYQNSPYPLISHHRMNETGYSFPSGHTIFSVSWLLVFAGLLAGVKGQAVVFAKIFAISWSALMLISRLRLGMHYPIDLFISTLIAWIFHLALFIWIVPRLENWTLFRKRG